MRSRILLFPIFLLFFTSAISQVTYDIPVYEDPDIGGMEYEDAMVFKDFFEHTNVGNMHVYPSSERNPTSDYYFHGEKIRRKWYKYFDRKWSTAHSKRYTAYATYAITIGDDLHFLIRFEGRKYDNSIELFTLNRGVITHRQTLASYNYELGIESQLDSWIQDFDRDTRKDILKKFSINYYWKERPEEYTVLYKQLSDSDFEKNENMDVDTQDFIMHETK